MLKNYLKIAFRNLYKNKSQTIIKTAGLALALAIGITIFSWIKYELGFDKFNKDSDQIYRVIVDEETVSAPPGFKYLFDKIPEVKYTARIFNAGFLGEIQKVSYNNKIFTNDKIYYADDDFFKIFSFPFVRGNPAGAFEKTNSAVITEAAANKYFGTENPIDKKILLSDTTELLITGVIKNIPSNSHFHFDILVTLKAHPWWKYIDRINFGSMWIFPTYIKINNQTGIENVKEKIIQAIQPYNIKPKSVDFQRLTDIHLHSVFMGELEVQSDINYIYLFGAVGILIIIMSCINYINLTTALSASREKEIGVRKAIGAVRLQLISQFTGESVILSLIAFLFSLILLEIISPLFLSFIGVNYSPEIFNTPSTLISAFIFTLFTGTVTGLFPAAALVKHNIINSVKPGLKAACKKSGSRGTLVIFQFSISIILIISSLIIYQQMKYVQNKKLGYNKDQVLVLNLGHFDIVNKIDVLKKLIAGNSNVFNVASCSQLPTNIKTFEGINTQDGKRYESYYIAVDKDFFRTLGIKIKKGEEQIENLIAVKNQNTETYKNKFVVNQTLLKTIGVNIKDTDAKTLIIRHGNMKPGSIIGVVDDFHFESLHNPIRPLVFEFTPENEWGNTYLLIKVSTENIAATINFIKQQWEDLADGLPFEYNFLNDDYNTLYKSEARTSHLFIFFTAVSIFIIVLGLLGLIAFAANQKTKEIGVRKVLGASIADILFLLSKKFILWIIIANVIAWPVAYYFINKWLGDFAYRIDISIWMFILSGGIAVVVALATVSYQAVKAASANPVQSLKYE